MLIYFASFPLMADCNLSDGINIAEGADKKVSLFNPGSTLVDHKVQDQDGLGTCYANSSSVLLKSILPTHPDISYHHAAITHSANQSKNKYESGNTKYLRSEGQDKVSFVNAGRICDTMNALKKSGGACPKVHSQLENSSLGDPTVQARLYHGLGKYFELSNSLKSNPTAQANLAEEIDQALEFIQQRKEMKSCGQEKIPANQGLKNMMRNLEINSWGCLSPEEFKTKLNFPNKQLIDEQFASILSSKLSKSVKDAIINSSFVFVPNPHPDLILKLEEKLKNDPEFIKQFDNFLKDPTSTPSKDLSLKMGLKMNEVLHELFPASKYPNCKFNQKSMYHPLTGVFFFGDTDDKEPPQLKGLGEEFLKGAKIEKLSCKTNPSDLLKSKEFHEEIKDILKTRNTNNSSCPIPHGDVIAGALLPLIELDQNLEKSKVKEILSNPFSVGAKQLKDFLMPECQDKENLLYLDNIQCKEYGFCNVSYSNVQYSGPENGCFTLDNAKKYFSKKAINSINNGTAFNVHTCSDFIVKDPKIKSKFCTNKSYSMHEMSVTGYRCIGGKMEYEVLNSWGTNYCPIGQDPAVNKSNEFECELNSDGKFTGRFWVKEDILVENTQTFSVISNKDKP
jgi:hypothetical protein